MLVTQVQLTTGQLQPSLLQVSHQRAKGRLGVIYLCILLPNAGPGKVLKKVRVRVKSLEYCRRGWKFAKIK